MERIKALDPGDVQKLLDSIPLRSLVSWRDRCICGFCYECAMRIGEVLKLQPGYVNIAKRRVWVPAEISKSKEDRYVYWHTDNLSVLLTEYKRKLGVAEIQGQYLFPSVRRGSEGKPLSYRAFKHAFDRYVRLAGLDDVGFPVVIHTLRHSWATDASNRNIPIRHIQEALGHKYVSSTQIYTHVTEENIISCMRDF